MENWNIEYGSFNCFFRSVDICDLAGISPVDAHLELLRGRYVAEIVQGSLHGLEVLHTLSNTNPRWNTPQAFFSKTPTV